MRGQVEGGNYGLVRQKCIANSCDAIQNTIQETSETCQGVELLATPSSVEEKIEMVKYLLQSRVIPRVPLLFQMPILQMTSVLRAFSHAFLLA